MITKISAVLVLLAGTVWAQAPSIAGDWQMTRQPQFGQPQYHGIHIEVDGENVKGTITPGPAFEGTFHDARLEATLTGTGPNPNRGRLVGIFRNGEFSGDGVLGDSTFTWTARRRPTPPASGPQTHVFAPRVFHNSFASTIPPALRIYPGDTVETSTMDAGGLDQTRTRRSAGGNPLTGPFLIEGAMPGDTLVVKLNRVRLNRDSAGSGDTIVPTAVLPGYHRGLKLEDQFNSNWTLDRTADVARLAQPTARLKDFAVALKPMLGCIGVAPPLDMSFRSGYLGAWGGNMDYNELVEGTTVYLPVYHPGALLFIGDGHAAEGDGELTGDALETSMDVSFTVDVIHDKGVPMPRAENAQYRMASGVDNSLDRALQQATTNLARWLTEDYELSANEVAVVLGAAIRYDIAEVVDPYVHVVAKIDKTVLARITK